MSSVQDGPKRRSAPARLWAMAGMTPWGLVPSPRYAHHSLARPSLASLHRPQCGKPLMPLRGSFEASFGDATSRAILPSLRGGRSRGAGRSRARQRSQGGRYKNDRIDHSACTIQSRSRRVTT